MQSNWFSVGEGLKALNSGKPKAYILRELIQNAWDEETKKCEVISSFKSPFATFKVTDDSPEGFKDIRDSYTLFNHTDKRGDPTKRGRFNFGEKQAFSVCTEAKVVTTKGSVLFDKDGRHSSKSKTKCGTYVEIKVKMTKAEYDEVLSTISSYLVPEGIKFVVNGNIVPHKKPFESFKAKLKTELLSGDSFRPTTRVTSVHVHTEENARLYEMGIPVTDIECQYSIDIQQKVPLGTDRDTVSPAYLKDVFAEVLNHTSDYIDTEDSSEGWIRAGVSDERISGDALKDIIGKRFGDKVCVADSNDPNSIDDALSHGYNVVYGREMGKDEWANVKKHGLIKSSSELFGANFCSAEEVRPNEDQERAAEYARRIAKRCLGISVAVRFVRSKASECADYGSQILTFNLSRLGKGFFSPPVSVQTTDLIVHELGHEKGNHTEISYHKCITKMAGKLVEIALTEPDFFKV